jgi:arsenite methyltransferase
MSTMDPQHIYQKVQEHYSAAASTTSGEYGNRVAKAFGYSEEELERIPQDANLGLSCGNPIALAKLKEVRSIPPPRSQFVYSGNEDEIY